MLLRYPLQKKTQCCSPSSKGYLISYCEVTSKENPRDRDDNDKTNNHNGDDDKYIIFPVTFLSELPELTLYLSQTNFFCYIRRGVLQCREKYFLLKNE